VEAVGCLRTSSATNVGEGKDSEARQRAAIERHAKAAGFVIVDWFYDAAVSGADPVETRPGFAAMIARIAGNGVRTIIVETANRFARDLMVQEVGFAMLLGLGVTLIAADSPASFLDDGPTSKLIRQILGAVAAFDKAMTVAKLKGARDRVRRRTGKCEAGNPMPSATLHSSPPQGCCARRARAYRCGSSPRPSPNRATSIVAAFLIRPAPSSRCWAGRQRGAGEARHSHSSPCRCGGASAGARPRDGRAPGGAGGRGATRHRQPSAPRSNPTLWLQIAVAEDNLETLRRKVQDHLNAQRLNDVGGARERSRPPGVDLDDPEARRLFLLGN
jgi:DNA invertase Pin-like site-specific DNA recombinase